MTGNELIKWINDWNLGERHIELQVRTKHGNFQKPFFGLHFDDSKLYLTAGEDYEDKPVCIPECPLNELRHGKVKPLPSCSYIGPNGEFYPLGGGRNKVQ